MARKAWVPPIPLTRLPCRVRGIGAGMDAWARGPKKSTRKQKNAIRRQKSATRRQKNAACLLKAEECSEEAENATRCLRRRHRQTSSDIKNSSNHSVHTYTLRECVSVTLYTMNEL